MRSTLHISVQRVNLAAIKRAPRPGDAAREQESGAELSVPACLQMRNVAATHGFGQSNNAEDVGPAEIDFPDKGSAEVGAAQIGALKVHSREHRALKRGPEELRLPKICKDAVGAAKRGSREIGAGKAYTGENRLVPSSLMAYFSGKIDNRCWHFPESGVLCRRTPEIELPYFAHAEQFPERFGIFPRALKADKVAHRLPLSLKIASLSYNTF